MAKTLPTSILDKNTCGEGGERKQPLSGSAHSAEQRAVQVLQHMLERSCTTPTLSCCVRKPSTLQHHDQTPTLRCSLTAACPHQVRACAWSMHAFCAFPSPVRVRSVGE